MIIHINSETKEVRVKNCTEEQKQDPNLQRKVGVILKQFADKFNPPEIPELYVNEDRLDDITEEMQIEFLTHHSGEWH